MSNKNSWNGEEDFARALSDLCGKGNNLNASKIKQVVNIAFEHKHHYKLVVYDVEKWMRKIPVEERLQGIYVVDGICRHCRQLHVKEKDYYSLRFLHRINEIISLFGTSSESDIVSSFFAFIFINK